jgi:GntR family transcriptional regulator
MCAMRVDHPYSSTMFAFVLHTESGVPVYVQLVQQVRNGIRMGLLRPGDRLPTAKEVVRALAVNPNTVLKAYRELEREGLVSPRPGAGTFIRRGLGSASPEGRDRLLAELRAWMERAEAEGMDDEDILALIAGAQEARLARRA